MEEEFSKFPIKKQRQQTNKQKNIKETVKMSRLCKAGLFFLRWITADPSPWGNFTPPTKHLPGEILGDLEPVYSLFTILGEITPSESLSRVTYTRINSMPSQKTKQPYIRSTSAKTRKNRTRKKKSVEDPQKSPKKFKKKWVFWIADINRITEDRKPLEQTRKKN